ncbi:basic amino acid ABC transporter substrate-binding protein [Sporolituus thermophilus]|uniref:Polar amino acid transport system substrate-binding protein n=1 Tax=Sporolituus thermophilus DSM 23256 TaxID=1123285 RepID=A0A1G7MKH2_9FIRM|nr:basic amino acid ABC transporter substrate-binding protein [Sporolituus thermophilus]SDF62388.1 polar amino acid transport system substrate-binding protein [Sporolituus thermophilus DSM 23256]
MSKKIITFIVLALFALTLGLAGCGQQKQQGQNQAAAPKVLKVGAETTFPPFEFQDEKTKEYTGFDVDLMKAIGKQLGYEVQIASMGFDALIPALEAGQIDVIASAMTITDERAKKVNFSKPYYKSGLTIVVKADNNTIKSFKDLEGKRIAVQIGTTGAEEAKKIKDAKVREFNSASEAYMELKAGGVDAVVNDKPVNDYYLAQGGAKDAKTVGDILQAEEYGIATAKKNTELANKINQALDELKKNGEYDKIYQKWFGQTKK